MTKRLNLFLIDGGGWSSPVQWIDDEEQARLAEIAEAGYWDEAERMFVPAHTVVKASITTEDELFDA